MKRQKMFFILLIIGLGMCSGLFAQARPGASGATRNTILFEDFGTVSSDWPVTDWTQLSGLFPSPTGTTTQWLQDDWLNVTTPLNKSAKINIYSTSRYGWLITPPINIPDGGYELKFDLGLT
ncbi:MAG: hypothetical protein LHW46_04245, partial [Candidatus Cloacimonetes bacterium]|nr:hypothetical protein [Candidatus Cloacimonadota bacterium]